MSSDSEDSLPEEAEYLEIENERLREEQRKLMESVFKLSNNLKELRSKIDLSLVVENEVLQEELKAYRSLVETLKHLSPDIEEDEWLKVSGDPLQEQVETLKDAFKPSGALLRELADEADMKVLSLLASSQTLQGGNWVKAKYPVGAPIFFKDLKFHYQLGKNWLGNEVTDPRDRSLNMRFDMFFPGFPASVASEVVWRLFCSEEHSRGIMRDDTMIYQTIHESCDPKNGDRLNLLLFENPLKDVDQVQQMQLSCRRTRRPVARSTLTIPRISRARSSSSEKQSKRVRSDDCVGNVDAFVVSQSSTKLLPLPKKANAVQIQGQVIRGSFAWQEADGARIVCVISYPADFLYNGQHRLSGNATYAFNEAGNVTKWFAKLLEHAAGTFVQYMLEETLHRRGRGVPLPSHSSSEEEEEPIRVVEMSSEASKFLTGLASTTKW